MNLDVVVLVGMVIAIPLFLVSRNTKAGVPKTSLLGTSSIIIGVCLGIASFQSVRAGVNSAAILLGLATVVWFYVAVGGTWDMVKEIRSDLKHQRQQEQERRLRNQALNTYDGMADEERQAIDRLAREWQQANGGSPYVSGRTLSILYVESKVLKGMLKKKSANA